MDEAWATERGGEAIADRLSHQRTAAREEREQKDKRALRDELEKWMR